MNEKGQDLQEIIDSIEFGELLHIGHLTSTFDWYNHKFEIKTLKIEEELVIGQLVKEFKDTIAEEKAAAVAIAAASLVSVNGKPFMPGYSQSAYVSIRDRYDYIVKNWSWVIIETINAEYLQLLTRMYETLDDIENLSKTDRMNSDFTSDPLTEQEL